MPKPWLKEALFWLHFFVILGGILMGLVLPWWLAVSAVIAHRIHLRLFDGCALSRLQKNKQCLGADQDYLQELSLRFFKKPLTKQYVKTADRGLVTLSLVVIGLTTLGYAWLVVSVVGITIAWYGVWAAWRMMSKQNNLCPVGDSCQKIKQSRYSTLFGIPVELLGISYFGVLTVLQLLLTLNNFKPVILQQMVTTLTILGLVFSVTLVFVQARILKSLCQDCMNIHGATLSFCAVQFIPLLLR